MKDSTSNKTPLSEEELMEIRQAYHSLEAFQLSPEHRKAKKALEARLASQKARGDAEHGKTGS
jgi:hypothetical protein